MASDEIARAPTHSSRASHPGTDDDEEVEYTIRRRNTNHSEIAKITKITRKVLAFCWMLILCLFIFLAVASILLLTNTLPRVKPYVFKGCGNGYGTVQCTLGDKLRIGAQAVTGHENSYLLGQLSQEYANHTVQHNHFTDINTMALVEDFVNITLTIADVVPAADLPLSLINATTNVQKMEIMQSQLLKLASLVEFGDLPTIKSKVFIEQFKRIGERLGAIRKELSEYELFLAEIDKKVFEIAGHLPVIKEIYAAGDKVKRGGSPSAVATGLSWPSLVQDRALKYNGTNANGTAAAISGIPALKDLKMPLLGAAFTRHNRTLNIPYSLLPSQDPTFPAILLGFYNTTLGINLSPTIANTLYICSARYFLFAWLPAPNNVYVASDAACERYSFAQAVKAGLGLTDPKWKWWDGEMFELFGGVNGGGGSASGEWTFSYGERDLTGVKWEVLEQ